MKAIASLGTFNTLMSGPARQGTFSEKVCGCCNRKFLHRLGGVPRFGPKKYWQPTKQTGTTQKVGAEVG